MEQFGKRLDSHTRAPDWACVIGEVEQTPVGYAYGYRVTSGRMWGGLQTQVDPGVTQEDGHRTFMLNEIMVKTPWRGTGVARGIHDKLMKHRREKRAALLVEQEHPRVQARYEEWGYKVIGPLLPFPDAPLYNAMALDLAQQ